MKHEIDLSKYKIRTDLAIELVNEINNVEDIDDIKVTYIYIDEEKKKIINKKIGNYITIEFNDITDSVNQENVKKVFTQELKKLLKKMEIKEEDSALIIGLGNRKSTPDSLGPESINKIIVTNHIYELGNLDKDFRRTYALNPGVMGETGIETSDIVKSVVDKVKPDFLIVIDALAASSIERVNRTVDAVTIVSDTIDYMTKHFTYVKENINNPINKLIVGGNKKHLHKQININEKDKKELLGLVGTLNNEEMKQLIHEVLTPIGYNFMVTPKEIDFIILKLSEIIGNGINNALHKKNM